MKKLITLSSLIMMFFFTFAQPVERDHVIVEIGTGTGCQFCPGAAMGADDLVSNGHDVGIIEYHNYNSSDPFNNSYAAARCSYYGIQGYPTAYFDGGSPVAGGSNSSSLYSSYLPKYNQKKAIPSDFTISIDGSSPTGQDYDISINVENVNNNTQSNLRLQVVVTESEIPYNWQGQNKLDFVERLMLPNQNGTNLDFSGGNTLNFDYSFSMGSGWNYEHCQLVVFIQNHSTKEILQGAILDLPEIIVPVDINAEVSDFYAPTEICSEEIAPTLVINNGGNNDLTSLDINYSINGGTEYSYDWTGNLSIGEKEIVNLPAIATGTLSATNTVNVHISNPNGEDDEYPSNDNGSASFIAATDYPNPPNMILYIKTDNNPEETTWEFKDVEGNILQSGGPYTLSNHTYSEALNITENACYSVVIYDEGGDGLVDGAGIFFILQGNNSLFEKVNFGYQFESQFTVGLVGVENNLLAESFKVFPNPVQEEAWIMYELDEQAKVNMKMFDVEGKLVNTSEEVQTAGVHSIRIDGRNFSNGIYFIELQVNEDLYKKKIVIAN